MSYKDSELKWAVNTKSGQKRQLPPSIYNNPIRMATSYWQLIEAPVEVKPTEPVSVNVPTKPGTEQAFEDHITKNNPNAMNDLADPEPVVTKPQNKPVTQPKPAKK